MLNGLPGDFRIMIEASYRGQRATAMISQSNVGTAKKGAGKWIAILGLAAGGAAVAALASKKGESNATPSTLGGHLKTGQRGSLQNRPTRTTSRTGCFYTFACPEGKHVRLHLAPD